MIKCNKNFSYGDFHCDNDFEGELPLKYKTINNYKQLSFSYIMYGIHKCSGSCMYCSAAHTMDYNTDGNANTYKFYPDKVKARIQDYFKKSNKIDIFSEDGKKCDLHVDIWGGNPLENRKQFKESVEFLKTTLEPYVHKLDLHTSGNGLELQNKSLCNYLKTNNIGYQLSHDGLGQWIRTGIIDPLYWDKTKDNIVDLARCGILNWINTTLSHRNYSFLKNIDYWNKWIDENKLDPKKLYIKLNHIYPGTEPIHKIWNYDDSDNIVHGQIKTGEEIGELTPHGYNLQEYLHEFRLLCIACSAPGARQSPIYGPFAGYITGQMNRNRILKTHKDFVGMCRQYQQGIIDYNFPIDSIGEYSQCNLIDSSTPVEHPSCQQPDYCKGCKFEFYEECHPCGSENYEKLDKESGHCIYRYAMNEVIDEIKTIRSFSNRHNK